MTLCKRNIALLVYLLSLFILPSFAPLLAFASADSLVKFNQAEYKSLSFEDEKEYIAQLYTKVINMKGTEDAENDFAAMFIEYNSGIRSLLENEIEKGKDNILTALAKQTLKRHKDAEEILKTYLGKVKLAKNKKIKESDETGSSPYRIQDSLKTIASRVRSIKLKNDQDYNFASIIGQHYLGSVSLIDDYLDKSDDATLEQVAKVLKDENQASIKIIEKWMQSHSK